MIHLYMMVGLPGSGKSTWWRQFIRHNRSTDNVSRRFQRFQTLSTDDTISDITQDYGLSYSDGFQELIKFAEICLRRDLTNYISKYKTDSSLSPDKTNSYICWDQTNFTKRSRIRKLEEFSRNCVTQGIPRNEITTTAVVLLTPLDLCVSRRSEGDKIISEAVISGMHAKFEMPTTGEGFNSIIQVS